MGLLWERKQICLKIIVLISFPGVEGKVGEGRMGGDMQEAAEMHYAFIFNA